MAKSDVPFDDNGMHHHLVLGSKRPYMRLAPCEGTISFSLENLVRGIRVQTRKGFGTHFALPKGWPLLITHWLIG